jgi:putative membrane protein
MHLGRRYKLTEFLGWTRWEAGGLILWSLLATVFLQVSHWNFLTIPTPVLTIVGSALAIIIAFKNQQCYARSHEALVTSGSSRRAVSFSPTSYRRWSAVSMPRNRVRA